MCGPCRSPGSQMATDGVACSDATHRRRLSNNYLLRTEIHGKKETVFNTRRPHSLQFGDGSAQSLHRTGGEFSFHNNIGCLKLIFWYRDSWQ